jgi:hypothetical protein
MVSQLGNIDSTITNLCTGWSNEENTGFRFREEERREEAERTGREGTRLLKCYSSSISKYAAVNWSFRFIFLQEKQARLDEYRKNCIRTVIGPSGTTVTFPESVGLPSIFNSKPVRWSSTLWLICCFLWFQLEHQQVNSLNGTIVVFLTFDSPCLTSFHQLSTSKGEMCRPVLHKPIQVPWLQDEASSLQPGVLQGCPGEWCEARNPREWCESSNMTLLPDATVTVSGLVNCNVDMAS